MIEQQPTYTIIPPEWRDVKDSTYPGKSHAAETAFGTYTAQSAEYRTFLFEREESAAWDYCLCEYYDEGGGDADDFEAAKAAAEAHYFARVKAALNVVEVTDPASPSRAKGFALPVEIKTGESTAPVRVVRSDLPGKLGCWDESTGTIHLATGQHVVGEHIILIHEALHVAETVMLADGTIKRRMPESFITGAGFVVAMILAGTGAFSLIDAADVRSFAADPTKCIKAGKA